MADHTIDDVLAMAAQGKTLADSIANFVAGQKALVQQEIEKLKTVSDQEKIDLTAKINQIYDQLANSNQEVSDALKSGTEVEAPATGSTGDASDAGSATGSTGDAEGTTTDAGTATQPTIPVDNGTGVVGVGTTDGATVTDGATTDGGTGATVNAG